MRKLLYTAVSVVSSTLFVDAMNQGISYHSALQEQKKHVSVLIPRCSPTTEKKLQEKFVENTKKILKNGVVDQKGIVSPLIHECKEIFFGTENTEDIKMYEEYEAETIDVQEAAEWIVNIYCGIPDAALRLQALYEGIGDYDRSLFWAIVSCDLGYKSGVEAVGRLISLRERRL